MKGFEPTRYLLENVMTGAQFPDQGWMLDDPGCTEPALVRAVYEHKQLEVGHDGLGLYKFSQWLPVGRTLKSSAPPVTYHSKGLGGYLGLKNLYITFSGWFPEKGAAMSTCSFKETEAYSVCGRMTAREERVLVVASAGNTARAFAKVCSENSIPLLLSVPLDNIDALWFEKPLNECVKLICPESGGDYFDAIHLSNLVLTSPGYVAEGGCKNIARRDGMGTTVLSAVTFLGMIPDFYFQAVGSGTGAIAAWEANLRFLADGRFGTTKMKLIVSQNAPFLPIYQAWKAGSRAMLPYGDDQARRDAEIIDAKVLSNRKPPYGIAGGLYDCLMASGGDVDSITNEELRRAAAIFEQTEGIDIHPAAATAAASLIARVEAGLVGKDKTVMLNITGGGEKRFKGDFCREQGKELYFLRPDRVFPLGVGSEVVLGQVDGLFY
ncbi:MAG: cysteate synthase [Rikenellaceae bacterium]|nr:cysteate synthase [Rikenellaceae bacterium]